MAYHKTHRKLKKFSIRFYKNDGTFVSEIVDYFYSLDDAWEHAGKIKKKDWYFNITKT